MRFYIDDKGKHSVDYETGKRTLIEPAEEPAKSKKKDTGLVSDPAEIADKKED